MSRWDAHTGAALLAVFGAFCAWTGVKLLTSPVAAVDPLFRRLARGSPVIEWLGARPDRPRRLLRAIGVALAAAGLAILLRAARLVVGVGPGGSL